MIEANYMNTSIHTFPRRSIYSLPLQFMLVAGLFFGAAITSAETVHAQRVRLEWSMAPRLEQSWEAWNTDTFNYDMDYVYPSDALGWSVTFNLCSSSGGESPIEEYSLTARNVESGYIWEASQNGDCRKRTRLEEDGKYKVTARVKTRDGRSVSHTETIEVKDWLIVIIGDSMSSGEGNPDQPGDYEASIGWLNTESWVPYIEVNEVKTPAVWKDRRCHRSALSGPVLAAKTLEAEDPHSSVTLINLACSGAEITTGLLESYKGMEPPERDHRALPPQVGMLGELVGRDSERGGRKIDVLLTSIGVNDMRFSDIIFECAKNVNNPASDNSGDCLNKLHVDEHLDSLDGKYRRLADQLEQEFEISEVYIAEYPADPIGGEGCGWLDYPAPEVSVSDREAERIQGLGRRLNREIRKAAEAHGWNYVGGMTEAFRGRAYCDDPSYFVGLTESIKVQGPVHGALHPNGKGHRLYKDLLLDAINLGNQSPHPRKRVTLTFKQVKVGSEVKEVPDGDGTNLDLPKGPVKDLPPGHFPDDFDDIDAPNSKSRPQAQPDLQPTVRFYVYEYQNDRPEVHRFRVPTFGKYVDLPSDEFTYTLNMYSDPAPPSHPVAMRLYLLSNGAQVNGYHGAENNYGEGTHELVHQTGKLSVMYTIHVEDLSYDGSNKRLRSITAYTKPNFEGTSQAFTPGVYEADDFWSVGNDRIMSIRIPSRMEVLVCRHRPGVGRPEECKTYAGDARRLDREVMGVSYLSVEDRDNPSRTLVIDGTGSGRTEYVINIKEGSGWLRKNAQLGSVQAGDKISNDWTTARGVVHGGKDAYTFTGELEDIELNGDKEHLTVTVDGEPI